MKFSAYISDNLPSKQVKKQYSRYAKLYYNLECPELTYLQARHKFVQAVGFFNWNDFIYGGFTDYQRTKMLSDWVCDFSEKRGYSCVSPLPSL